MSERFDLLLKLISAKEQEVLELLGEVTRQWQQAIHKQQEMQGYKQEYLQDQSRLGQKDAMLVKKNAHFILQLDIAIEQQTEQIDIHDGRRQQVLGLYSNLRSKRQLFEKKLAENRAIASQVEEKKVQQAINDASSWLLAIKQSPGSNKGEGVSS